MVTSVGISMPIADATKARVAVQPIVRDLGPGGSRAGRTVSAGQLASATALAIG